MHIYIFLKTNILTKTYLIKLLNFIINMYVYFEKKKTRLKVFDPTTENEKEKKIKYNRHGSKYF